MLFIELVRLSASVAGTAGRLDKISRLAELLKRVGRDVVSSARAVVQLL